MDGEPGEEDEAARFFSFVFILFCCYKDFGRRHKVTDSDRRSLKGLPIDFHLIVKPSPIFLLSIFFLLPAGNRLQSKVARYQ